MQSFCGFILIFLLTTRQSVVAEIFTSLEEFRGVIHAQQDVVDELKDYLSIEMARIAKIESLIRDFEEDSLKSDRELAEYLSNPMNVYSLIKRNRREMLAIDELMWNETAAQESLERVRSLTDNFPSSEDVVGSAVALHRLQETYQLDPAVFAEGRLPGLTLNNTRLTSTEIFDIGKVAYNRDNWGQAALWLQEALNRLQTEPLVPGLDRAIVLDYLAFAYYKSGQVLKALELTEELLDLVPDHPHASKNRKHYMYLLHPENLDAAIEEMKKLAPLDQKAKNDLVNYQRLCRGESIMENEYSFMLNCDYATNNDPRLLIAPLKRETLSIDPWIFRYYDAITEEEMQFLKLSAAKRLTRAEVFGGKEVDYRITKTAWVPQPDDDHLPELDRLNKRITAMTQLNHQNVESFQVANYGIGGHYTPHHDYTTHTDSFAFTNSAGNRIATLIFYLSEVKSGGATVFPEIGLRADPVKGSAVMWFNLMKSGVGDVKTIHGACPVIVGDKWIATRWFHERSNELWYPCSTDELETFQMDDFQSSMEDTTYQRAHGRMSLPIEHVFINSDDDDDDDNEED